MLDPDLVQELLSTALATGGRFAEVFAEDRVSTSLRLDDGKREEVVAGADRGAGVRGFLRAPQARPRGELRRALGGGAPPRAAAGDAGRGKAGRGVPDGMRGAGGRGRRGAAGPAPAVPNGPARRGDGGGDARRPARACRGD